MSGVVEESVKIEKSLFGFSPTESFTGGSKPDAPAPEKRSPLATRSESTASAQERFAAERRRKRRRAISAPRLGAANLAIGQLGA
jgi:hypothetical protein